MADAVEKQLSEQVRELLEADDKESLGELLGQQRSGDIAEVVAILDNDQRRMVLDALDDATAGEVVEKLDEATREALFDLLDDTQIRKVISEVDLDDAADLLAELPEEAARKALRTLKPSEAGKIRSLMRYTEDSAGGIMDPVVVSVREDATVAEAIAEIRRTETDEDFYSVYVVDPEGKFIGDVRLRLLLTRPEDTRMRDLVNRDTVYVVTEDDQERVRNVFSKYDLIAVPVLDDEHRLVGRITADRVLEVAEEEAAEDLYAMAGTDPDERESFSAAHAARVRMTWLLPCLLGTAITATVMTFFRRAYAGQEIGLLYGVVVAFVPMIAAISGNAGLQTSAIVVSGLATGHLAAMKLRKVFSREVRIALLVALSCGVIGGLACSVLIDYESLQGTAQFMRIIFAFGVAMFAAIMVATTLGLFLPFFFRRVNIDPAISSGPLVTTANDSISVAIFLSLTFLLAV